MPSKNSINKPTDRIKKATHSRTLSKRRANRVPIPVPGPHDVKSIAYYTGSTPQGSGVTTNTLSRKRQKKLERNSRYVAKRNELLSVDLAAQSEGMEVDAAPSDRKERNKKPQTTLEKVKEALWTVVGDHNAGAITLESSGEGTTLGIQSF